MASTSLYTIGLALRIERISIHRYAFDDLDTRWWFIRSVSTSLGRSRSRPARREFITVVHLVIEVVCIAVQSVGAAIGPSSSTNNHGLGKTLLLAGIIIQIVSFSTFTGLYVLFAHRLKKSRPEEWKARPCGRFKHFTFFVYMMGFPEPPGVRLFRGSSQSNMT
ncbi:hypothetical protein FS749_001206 [Ceratobasidium sp. UAMH 11750]|nr:hypothetical protein FS749_001206 [Ceratobasidium sp. UAMH 11750]